MTANSIQPRTGVLSIREKGRNKDLPMRFSLSTGSECRHIINIPHYGEGEGVILDDDFNGYVAHGNALVRVKASFDRADNNRGTFEAVRRNEVVATGSFTLHTSHVVEVAADSYAPTTITRPGTPRNKNLNSCTKKTVSRQLLDANR